MYQTRYRFVISGRKPRRSMRQHHITGVVSQNYEEIKRNCLARRTLFEDPEFPAESSSLYYSQPPKRRVEWKRPKVSLAHFAISCHSYLNVKMHFLSIRGYHSLVLAMLHLGVIRLSSISDKNCSFRSTSYESANLKLVISPTIKTKGCYRILSFSTCWKPLSFSIGQV